MSVRPSPPRPSILDIARQAGVSPATVSRVFNAPASVSDATRLSVQAAAAQSGYRPNGSARRLRTRRSQVVGVILPTLTNPVFAECLQGIAQATAARGFSIMPTTSNYHPPTEGAAARALSEFGVDGAILVVSDAGRSPAIAHLQAHGIPYVLVYNRHPQHPCVSVAGDTAMRELVQRLARLGHRRIAMVCGQRHASDRAAQRHQGFVQGMAEAGLEPAGLIEVPFLETAVDGIAAALAGPNRPTALVCSNDLLAMRALRAAHVRGLRVPDDVSIVGFDGIAIGRDLTPSLGTVAQPNTDMGRCSVALLLDALAAGEPPQPSASITLPFHFLPGESCSRAPGTVSS